MSMLSLSFMPMLLGGGAGSVGRLDTTIPTIGGDFTFTRASIDWAPNAAGVYTQYAVDTPMSHYTDGVQDGFWFWPTRDNAARRNSNPTALTSAHLISGGAVLSDVLSLDGTQGTALTAAGLGVRCTGNVYKLTAGASDAKIYIDFGWGTTQDCSLSCFAKTTDTNAGYIFPQGNENFLTEITNTGNVFQYFKLENIKSTDLAGGSSAHFAVCARAGKTIWFILQQAEKALMATSPIDTATVTATRAASILKITNLNQKPYFGLGAAATIFLEFTPVSQPIAASAEPPDEQMFMLTDGTTNNVMGVKHGYRRAYLDSVNKIANVEQLSSQQQRVGPYFQGRKNYLSRGWGGGTVTSAIEDAKPFGYTCSVPSGLNTAYFFSDNTGAIGFSGVINRIEIYPTKLSAPAIAGKAPRTNRKCILTIGQSWMENWAGNQGDRDTNPRRNLVAEMTALDASVEWDLLTGSTGGTSFDRVDISQTADLFWYDHDLVPGTFGQPFLDCIGAVTNALRQGSQIPIILHTNHVTTRNPAVYGTLLNGVYGFIYDYLQDLIEAGQGYRPKILMIPHSRRDSPASSSGSTYQLNRAFNADLLTAFSGTGFDLAPEFYGAGANYSDGVHWSTQSYFNYAPLIAKKIFKTLGGSVAVGVNGPRISAVSRLLTAVTVDVTHDTAGVDFSNADPNDYQGFFAFNGDGSAITISSAVRADADTMTVTLAALPTGAATFYYGYGEMRDVPFAKVPKDQNGLALRYSGPWDIS